MLMIITGVAHILTRSGRTALYIVGHKMLTFVRLCVGVWYEADVIAYGIHKKVFDSSSVWCNPNLLLHLEKNNLMNKYHEMRRSKQVSIPYDDLKVLAPDSEALTEDLQQDYASTLHSLIALRACLIQAIPYMSLLSIFASFVCSYPIAVKSESLKACLLPDWVEDATSEARKTIQDRINTNASIRADDVHEHVHDIPNPEFDSDGITIPEATRILIAEINKTRQEQINLALSICFLSISIFSSFNLLFSSCFKIL